MAELKYLILREIGNLARIIQTINDVRYSDLDLHKNQYIFLTRICENEGINLKELSIMLKVDKTTTTKAVQKLIGTGYIKKVKSPDDARITMLYTTEKALKVYERLIEEENRIIDICFQSFSEDEVDQVHQLIEAMNGNMKDNWLSLKNYKEEEL